MRDIVSTTDGLDLGVALSSVPKAANVLSTQLGELEYASDFGVDKKYFLDDNFLFQSDSYRAHLIQRLTEAQINVGQVVGTIDTLFATYSFGITEPPVLPDFSTSQILDNVLTDADGAPLTDADGSYLTDATP